MCPTVAAGQRPAEWAGGSGHLPPSVTGDSWTQGWGDGETGRRGIGETSRWEGLGRGWRGAETRQDQGRLPGVGPSHTQV